MLMFIVNTICLSLVVNHLDILKIAVITFYLSSSALSLLVPHILCVTVTYRLWKTIGSNMHHVILMRVNRDQYIKH